MISLPRTLRSRLTVWYLGSTVFIFTLLSLVFGAVMWIVVHDQIDHHTHVVVTEAKRIVEQSLNTELPQRLANLVGTKGMTVVLLSSDGTPILQTNSADLAAISEHQLQRIFLTAENSTSTSPNHFSINQMRFATAQVTDAQGRMEVLAVGYSTEILEQTFWRLLLSLLSITFVMSCLFGWFGYLLLKRSLQPLETIARTAGSISRSAELHRRVKVDQPTTELEIIAAAFNQMLARLEKVFLAEHEFFADTAHGLKTPLALLRARVEKLARVSAAEKESLLRKIDDLASTIQDLLFVSSLSTIEAPKKENVSISNLMRQFAQLAQAMGEEKKLTVTSNIEPDIALTTDPRLLKRLLSNLVHNAVKYSQPKGTIRLAVTSDQKKSAIIIRITDDGIGIPKADQPRVFDRFFRARNAIELGGTGLGLAIAKTITENLGGKIRLRSELGQGTTVTLTFPISSSLHLS